MTLLMPCIACFGRRLMVVAGPRILARRRATMRNGVSNVRPGSRPGRDSDTRGALRRSGHVRTHRTSTVMSR